MALEYYDCKVHGLGEPANKGKPWTYEELDDLRRAYHRGLTLIELCKLLGRPPTGVTNKLCELNILGIERGTYLRYVKQQPKNKSETQVTEKEIVMSNANIETKVFIQGKDATEMTDAQIFSLIAKLEGEQDKLSQIKNKPKKLVAAIESLTTDIQKLVDYVDAR